MGKIVKILLILFLISILTLVFFRNSICRRIIYNAVAKGSGLQITIEDLNLDILNSSFLAKGITLLNPSGFKDRVLGQAQEIFIKYDPWACFSGRIHLYRLKIDIDEINIIRNEQGDSNVSAFKKWKSQQQPSSGIAGGSSLPKGDSSNKKERPRLLIDRLELSSVKVTFIDYQAGIGESALTIFTAEGPFVFRDVDSLGYVADSVSVKTGIRQIINNLLGAVQQEIFKNAAETMKSTAETMKTKVRDVLNRKGR